MLSRTRRMRGACGLLIPLLLASTAGRGLADQPASLVQAAIEQDGVTVTAGGQLFARYLFNGGGRPIVWPIMGPTQRSMTRGYPVGPLAEGEERDHPHHRSLWLGYEGVNGCDFWHGPEPGVTRPLEIGSVKHRELMRADSDGLVATVATRNDWLNASGAAIAHDERLLQFGADDAARWIDFRVRLWSAKGPLVIGDSKEGCFGLRVASSMRVDEGRGGRIVTSRGGENDAMWGQQAEWCDYQGPVDGALLGVTLMSHPDSDVPLPRWHVRTYGLHAANPFGAVPFGAEEPGGMTIPAGKSLRLRYRVFLHQGNEREAKVAEHFQRFSASK